MKLNSLHQNWLKGQKITDQVIEDFGLYTSDDGNIAFPVYDIKGDFIFNKYRKSPEKKREDGAKYTYDRGGKVSLYGYHLAKDYEEVLITEGEKDCLVAWSHNIPAVTSTGGAMSFQEEWIELLKDKKITICFDNDKAGGQGMAKVAKMFGLENVRLMFLPNHIKDISDFVSAGKDLHSLYQKAKVIDSVLDDLRSRNNDALKYYFHSAWLDTEDKEEARQEFIKGRRKINKNITNDKLLAKEYPIYQIIDINKRTKKTCCPFHNEKTPSLHYYEDSNTVYCFGGCGRAYDAIDVYMKKWGVSFKEAVEELSNKLK